MQLYRRIVKFPRPAGWPGRKIDPATSKIDEWDFYQRELDQLAHRRGYRAAERYKTCIDHKGIPNYHIIGGGHSYATLFRLPDCLLSIVAPLIEVPRILSSSDKSTLDLSHELYYDPLKYYTLGKKSTKGRKFDTYNNRFYHAIKAVKKSTQLDKINSKATSLNEYCDSISNDLLLIEQQIRTALETCRQALLLWFVEAIIAELTFNSELQSNKTDETYEDKISPKVLTALVDKHYGDKTLFPFMILPYIWNSILQTDFYQSNYTFSEINETIRHYSDECPVPCAIRESTILHIYLPMKDYFILRSQARILNDQLWIARDLRRKFLLSFKISKEVENSIVEFRMSKINRDTPDDQAIGLTSGQANCLYALIKYINDKGYSGPSDPPPIKGPFIELARTLDNADKIPEGSDIKAWDMAIRRGVKALNVFRPGMRAEEVCQCIWEHKDLIEQYADQEISSD